jgi:hypothetical protein
MTNEAEHGRDNQNKARDNQNNKETAARLASILEARAGLGEKARLRGAPTP